MKRYYVYAYDMHISIGVYGDDVEYCNAGEDMNEWMGEAEQRIHNPPSSRIPRYTYILDITHIHYILTWYL